MFPKTASDLSLIYSNKMILLGVIHKLRPLRGGNGGPAKKVLAQIGGRESFSCKRTYAIVFFRGFVTK